MKLTTILPLLLLQTTTHATIFNRASLPTVGEAEDLAAPTVVLKRTNPELTAPTVILKRARKAADPDPEEQIRPDDIRTKVVKRARPAPTVVGKRARKYADPDPEEQMGPIDPDSTRTRVAKRINPAPTVFAKRARKYADPDPEEQMGPIDPDSTRTRVAKRAKPAPTVVEKRARKYADPDPEEQLRPVDPDSTRTRVAKRAKPAPTIVEKRARKYADPDPEEQLRPVDPDSTRTRVAKRANPAPTVVERRDVVDDQGPAPFQVITLPTGRVEVPVHAHTPISTADINARPAGVLNSIGLNFGTLCSAFIPFTNAGTGAEEFPDHSGPRVYIDVDGANVWANSPKGLIVDTGSTGFTIGQLTWTSRFGKSWPSTDKSRPGWKYLSSSNILYKGYWVNVNITFKDLSWNPIIRSEVPVLVFNQKFGCEKIDNATGNCLVTPSILDAEGAYMGIGYGRRADGMTQCTPDTNPLLNVRGIWRDLPATGCNYRNGYVVTKTGISWGLTVANTNGFKFHTLKKDSTVNMDWSMPTMCLRASNNAQTCRVGNFLPDTGLTKSYITSPDTPSGTAPPSNGFNVKLNIPNSGQGMGFLNYNNVGTGGNHLPSSYSTWKNGDKVYLNTGSRFFNAYKTAFDADSGYFGIKEL
ncbi:hypothetical protein TWF192_008788 [Orbilia oligospora]|uniref:Peptidase A1 domain-containing protein n=1 Tax=Orbilia oligospora TaxID=2813651 RepID=A0A6G1M1F9_ORBOL|nr:hypothetical protein TWF679_002831 [Orbilia oligospora]KAF3222745.1 hypothetical protein TWF191_006564 [Orbilia oligospora]KAF3242016.1 hypothetical protein TWF192_008788 [Orbilia oligospora]